MEYHVLFWNLCIVYSVWIRLNIFVTSNICNFFFVAFIEMGGSHFVAQAGLEFMILLDQPLKF